MLQKKNTFTVQTITVTALLLALQVVLGNLIQVPLLGKQYNLGFVPIALAGAMLACLACGEDFDTAMILAVNHSGRSAAVGALTGAFLGARLGAEALPDFYLESLEAAPILEQLAEDLAVGSMTSGLFNDDWDHRYTQGLPPL